MARFSNVRWVFLAVAIAGLCGAAVFILGGEALSPLGRRQAGTVAGTAERYLTHISTDKPIYRTGEKVYVRGVFLRANGHTPMSAQGTASFEIKGPKGDTVASGMSAIADSVAGFSWDVPPAQAGGEYAVRILYPSVVASERKFDIRAYRAPRLKSQIVFVRDGYGPGDKVSATLHVERAEGGVPAGARVSVTARVDGAEIWNGETTLDGAGNAGAGFKLPAEIARGEGILAMTIQDGGTVETASKTIPILLQTIDLAIYPEGGDLVAGLPNRVYIEGRTPVQKPADMAGIVVNAAGKQIAAVRTEHEGRGRFFFTPSKGEKYSLRITEPAGIKTVYPLPPVKDSGVVIASLSDVVPRKGDVTVRVGASDGGTYTVELTQRGRELSSKNIALRPKQTTDVAFTVPKSLDGVIVATVYDDRRIPRAERLLFRQPENKLKVEIVPDRTDYVPGDKVTLRIKTTDEAGKPVGGVVGLTVTDSGVLEMIEKREQAPRLPVMALLENDVKDLADAHVYLDETNPKAPRATDLLLGTQGWRRFLNAGTGVVNGEVMDSTGAVILGATVRATNRDTGETVETRTASTGAYAFPNIRAGRYELTASLSGFRAESVPDVQVRFNSTVRQDVRLTVMPRLAQGVGFGAGRGGAARAIVAGNVIALDALQKDERADWKRLGVEPADLKQQGLQGQLRQQLAVAPPMHIAAGFVQEVQFDRAATVLTVREYAHALRPNWTEGSRSDFAETVYWNAGVKTDDLTGTATVSFNLSDSVTSFSVLADGFSQDGALGSGIGHVEAVEPFSIEPKIPLQVTSGDIIDLPVNVINGMSRELRGVEINAGEVQGLKFSWAGESASALRPKERARRLLRVDVGAALGPVDLTLDARAGLYRDSVSRKLDVQPLGFPHESSAGGMLESNGSKSFEFTLPAEIIGGSVSSAATVYPTPLASMTDSLQSLLREPNGCFEQTSSTSYPMVMAQQYFLTHSGIDSTIVERARNLVEASYKRLTGFESRSRGYEWFGADPGHEALTAYGLMQFTDMAQVRSVDKEMLDRTRAWLLSRRDGNGGFKVNPKALDSFGRAPADTTNAYIVWALTEAGEKGFDKEIASVKATAGSTDDSYVVALAANILHAAGDHAGARTLMERLAKNQDSSGAVAGAVTSITRSGGEALAIETTALSTLAWLQEPAYALQLEKGLRWLVESNKSGRFGSTQSTILALRAIVAYDAAHPRPKAPGRIVLSVDGKTAGQPLAFTADTQGALVLPEFASKLRPGKHTVALRMEDGSSMPYSISVKYSSTLPDSSVEAQVGIQVVLKDRQIPEGGATEAVVSIANKSDQVVPMPVAIVGIPGGLEVRHDQLKELVKSGRIDAYEVIGREVVLYWRYLKAKQAFDLPVSLIAAVPGTYTGPASRAYLYYTDEYKSWAPGLSVKILAR